METTENLEGQVTDTTQNNTNGNGADDIPPHAFDALLKSNKAYQSEFDRRVAKGISTAKEKWIEDQSKALAANDPIEPEANAAQIAFDEERTKFEAEKHEAYANKLLALRGIPPEAASFLMGADMDETIEKVNAFMDIYGSMQPKEGIPLSQDMPEDKHKTADNIVRESMGLGKNANGSVHKQDVFSADFEYWSGTEYRRR